MTQSASQILAPDRARLDELDRQLLDLLVERMGVCLTIADLKAQHRIPMMQPGRVSLVIERARARAVGEGLDPEYLGGVFRLVIDATCAAEDARMASGERGEA
ncbi:chorismate mutase [Rathayibacter tanaceti]|uniref:Chorismate mutase n=2 Tax=Rathayibacter tanaceti TaxID=1671680 RepID=A0A166IPK4_9MICO|nr:chorismate mutase [Rathayibacter tanaceti]KZX22721.1 chorismate mutase [Rathayibacter tanaceti]QHC55909.1 chorismate mutase [Rathayibacter tanaceti]TCO39258.1 chorismate mutase [Rathayibacter tanaceti]